MTCPAVLTHFCLSPSTGDYYHSWTNPVLSSIIVGVCPEAAPVCGVRTTFSKRDLGHTTHRLLCAQAKQH